MLKGGVAIEPVMDRFHGADKDHNLYSLPDTMGSSQSSGSYDRVLPESSESRRKIFIPGITGRARCLDPSSTAAEIISVSSNCISLSTNKPPLDASRDVPQTPKSKKKTTKKKKKKRSTASTTTGTTSASGKKSIRERKLENMLLKDDPDNSVHYDSDDEASERPKRSFDDADVDALCLAQTLHDSLLLNMKQKKDRRITVQDIGTQSTEVLGSLLHSSSSSTGEASLHALLNKDASATRSYDDHDVDSVSLTQNLHDSILNSIMKCPNTPATQATSISSFSSSTNANAQDLLQDVGFQDESILAVLSPSQGTGAMLTPRRQTTSKFGSLLSGYDSHSSAQSLDASELDILSSGGSSSRRFYSRPGLQASDPDLYGKMHAYTEPILQKATRSCPLEELGLPQIPMLPRQPPDSSRHSKTTTTTSGTTTKTKKKSTKDQKKKKSKDSSKGSRDSSKRSSKSHKSDSALLNSTSASKRRSTSSRRRHVANPSA